MNALTARDDMLVHPGNAKKVAAAIAALGQHGDTMLAHIGPSEARLLKSRGGSGKLNPLTGLPSFANEGAQGNSGGGGTGGPGGGNAGANGGGGNAGGNAGGGNGGGGNALGGSSEPTGLRGPLGPTGLAGQTLNGSSFAGNPNPMGSRPGSDTSVSHDVAASMGLSPDAFTGGAVNLGKAVTNSYNNGAFSSVGAFLGNLFGFNQNLVNQPFGSYVQGLDKASWGFDPAGLIGGVAGLALGVPGLSSIADYASDKLGRPMEVGLSANPSQGYGPHGSGGANGLVGGGSRY